MANAGSRGAIVLIASLLVAGSCRTPPTTDLLLASTTSTEDSGLFDVLLPAFHSAHPEIRVRLTAVGSGQALELGRRGDVDVLLVHSPAQEEVFMQEGHGRTRLPVMHNDFVIVGPPSDPAGTAEAGSAASALQRIIDTGGTFVSRGDDSGTHAREIALWRAAGLVDSLPAAPARIEVGQGMGETLTIAAERGGYTLTDRGTWLAHAATLRLALLFDGDDALLNPYTVITVARARQPAAAEAFAAWITSPDAARVIGEFGAQRFGRPLFVPAAARD